MRLRRRSTPPPPALSRVPDAILDGKPVWFVAKPKPMWPTVDGKGSVYQWRPMTVVGDS